MPIIDNKFFTDKCPHCNCGFLVDIKQLNCRIFRCGIYKHNNKQINPHMKKEQCDKLYESGKIWGCGKPFRVTNEMKVEICGYI